jgi:hypothetical protein
MSDRVLAGGVAALVAIMTLIQLLWDVLGGDVMSAFFNLLLFVGVFYLILQISEPGDRRAKRAHGSSGDIEPGRKVA